MGPSGDMMWGMGWFGTIITVAAWVGSLVLMMWGLSRLFPPYRETGEQEALHILRQRYARGEISRAEFEEARVALER